MPDNQQERQNKRKATELAAHPQAQKLGLTEERMIDLARQHGPTALQVIESILGERAAGPTPTPATAGE